MSENIGLIIELKTIGKGNVLKDASDVKQFFEKSAKESASVFAQAIRERSRLEAEWASASKNRSSERVAIERAENEAISRSYRDRKAEESRVDSVNFQNWKRDQAEKTALAKSTALGQRDSQVRTYQKYLSDRDTGMGPRDSHVYAWKAVQAEKIAIAKAVAAQEKAALADVRKAESAATMQRRQEAREVERARIAAARTAAREEQASNRGFRVGIGAVAGQGFSVGGIASVNPYAAAGLAAAYAVKNVATDLVAEATVWEKFKVALTDIEGSAVKAAQATDDLYELAKRPGIGLKEAEQTYIQFRALNMEGAKAQKVIAAVSNAVALSGGGATEFQRVNYQITQMLSKGKVLEEDLRIMRNSLPRLTVAMRDAFGTTTAEGIRKAGVNAEEFLAKIVTQFEKLPKASQTLESATENAETAWSRLKASLVDTDKVKGSIEVWTSFLETLTDVVNARSEASKQNTKDVPSAAAGAMYDVNEYSGGYYVPKDPYANENAKANKYGITEDYLTTGNFSGQSAQSLKEYNNAQQRIADQKKKDAVEEAKLMASINLENEKLRIQLKDISDYEKQKLITIAEYNSQISLAEKEYQKKGLREQLALQLRKLALDQEKQITEELQKQAKAADDAFANATGISYAAYSIAHPGGVDKDLPGYRPSLTKSMVENDNKTIEDQAKAWEEWNKQIKEQADAWQKSVDAGKDLSMKYAPEWDKLKMEYDKELEALNQAVFSSLEERNRVAKALNDQYVRDQIEMLGKTSVAVTSAGQSLFSDLANASKMGIDYRYNLEKANVEKRLSLTGLEGDARVAQQRRRDEALEALDEKRQKDMQGSYLTMFMIAKGFALAESAIKLNLAIANAAASGPFPANLAAMAAVAAAVGSVVTNIAEINYAGAFDKGGNIPSGSWGIAGEYGPEIVQGPARVTSRADTAAMLGGKGNVIVNNYGNDNVSVKQSDNGKDIEIIIGEVSKQVESNLTTGIRSGRGEFQNSIKETFGLTRRGY